MGRTIKIQLSDEHRAELENGYQTADNHVFRVRCQMVLLKSENRKSTEVGAILGFCEQTINGWLWRYKENGIAGLKTQPGQGRVPILKLEEDAPAVRLSVAEHRQRISQAQAELEQSLGKRFSEKTLRRFLKNCAADINASESVPANRKQQEFIGIK